MCVCVCVYIYQKAVKLKKLVVVAIEAIEPAAKTHCEILRRRPVKVPGVPGKSFIFFFFWVSLPFSQSQSQES